MNPIKRIFIAFLLCFSLIIFLAYFTIPDVGELPMVFIVAAVTVTPIILLLSFSIDILLNKKWVIANKKKVIIFYIIVLVYLILYSKWIIIAFEDLFRVIKYLDIFVS